MYSDPLISFGSSLWSLEEECWWHWMYGSCLRNLICSIFFSLLPNGALSTGSQSSSRVNCSNHAGICTCLKHFISSCDKITQNIKKRSSSSKSCWHSTGYLFWTGWLTKKPAVTTYERTQNNEAFRKKVLVKGIKKDTIRIPSSRHSQRKWGWGIGFDILEVKKATTWPPNLIVYGTIQALRSSGPGFEYCCHQCSLFCKLCNHFISISTS